MKLLLTSGGLTNKSIEIALFDLVGKKPEDTTLCFIPTAATAEMGDKDWFINDLKNIDKQGFKSITIVDIGAIPKEKWKPQLDEADVLFFSGVTGFTFFIIANFTSLQNFTVLAGWFQLVVNTFVFVTWSQGFRNSRGFKKFVAFFGVVVPIIMASVTILRVLIPWLTN